MSRPVVRDGDCGESREKRERNIGRHLEACYSPKVYMVHKSWSVLSRRLLYVEKTIGAWRELIIMPTCVESVHGYLETRTINNGKSYPNYEFDLPLGYLRRPKALHMCWHCHRHTHSGERYMLKCPVCKLVRYCSDACYRADRVKHVHECVSPLTDVDLHVWHAKKMQTCFMFQSMTMTLVDAARGLSMHGKFAPIYSVVLTGTKSVTVSLSPLKLDKTLRSVMNWIDNETLKNIMKEPIDKMILVVFMEGPRDATVIPEAMVVPLLKRHEIHGSSDLVFGE